MAQNTCSVDGCQTASVCRGWCRHHYNQQYKGVPLTQVATHSECPHCGQRFTAGRGRIYCSQRCREDIKYQALRNNPAAWQAYLSRTRDGYVKKTEQPGYTFPKREPIMCTIDGCDRQAKSRSMCPMHYKRWARANGMEQSPSNKWSDTRRSNYHARRARMNGASSGDRVLQAELLLRDGPTCSGCGDHVDVDIPYPDPHSPSVDHTIPLSKGGEHSMANCTIMHLRCNIVKGARLTA